MTGQSGGKSEPRCASCPVCFGRGQITGPKSLAFESMPEDPFNAKVRDCGECEGTGVVTAIRAAALNAESIQVVMAIVDRVYPEGHVAAVNEAIKLEKELGL